MLSALPTIVQAVEQIRTGQLTPLELLELCLERIRRFEPQIRAWVQVDEVGARAEALRLGHLAGQNQLIGPLHGIPIGIKDIIDVAEWPTQAGSSLRQNHVAECDAPVVTALREAGAIILGKTVTTEFACFDPSVTRNPWNLNHTPGGSSSGSAAAVALGMCVAALGSQTGGSIIRPASYCGVVGLKPTFGRVPRVGVVPISQHLDHVGPIARCVSDAEQVFQVIDEPTAHSRYHSTSDLPSLWVLDGFFREQSSAPVLDVTDRAIDRIRDAWPSDPSPIQPGPWPTESFAEVHAMHRRIMAVGAACYHRHPFAKNRSAFGKHVAALVEEGLAIAAVDNEAALEHQNAFRLEMDAALPEGWIALMPATDTTAPASLETTGNPKFSSPWSYAGLPAITIPCGLAADGMPCGLQLVGRPHSEEQLLRAALRCESILAFVERPLLVQKG